MATLRKPPGIARVEPYTALSDVYQTIGLADYSKNLAPRLFDLAFELEWAGRTLIDLGCGTGDLACWFSERSFRVVGVDTSPAMLKYGHAMAEDKGFGTEFVQADMRIYKPDFASEMVTCLGGALNYLPTLRDLETVFRQVNSALEMGKLFYFDLRTIQGLVEAGGGDEIMYNNESDLLILTRSKFNYETLILTIHYIIVAYDPDIKGWRRTEELHVIRGYPIQAVASLLNKAGFRVLRTLTPDFRPAEEVPDAKQVIIAAVKES